MDEKQITIEQFLTSVGRQRFRTALGLSDQLMTRAVEDGLMPSSWYFDVRDWCVANRVDVPEHLFKRRKRKRSRDNSKQNVYSAAPLQGEQT